MIKAALFDLDGVVFDTESQYSIFWGMIGREYHPEMPDFEYRIKGQTLVQIYDKYFTDDHPVYHFAPSCSRLTLLKAYYEHKNLPDCHPL